MPSSARAARLGARGLFGGVLLASLLALGLALLSQHAYGMQPCPWCVLQRAVFAAIAIVALIGLLLRGGAAAMACAIAMAAFGLAGVAAAAWQHWVAAASPSCNQTLADRVIGGLRLDALLPEVFEARATCADAAVRLFGVPYEFFSLGLFAAIVLAVAVHLRRGSRGVAERR